MSRAVTRFAPSPTGRLHLGHAFSAREVWRLAEEMGAEVLLRIEDIDQGRCRPEFDAGVIEDLAWLGFTWRGDIRRQAQHFQDYRLCLEGLAARGLVYRCFRTRKEVAEDSARAPHGPEGWIAPPTQPLSADEEEARLAAGEMFAWRLSETAARDWLGEEFGRLEACFDEEGRGTRIVRVSAEGFGDVVLGRKDCPASYHLASVHDDALQGVTHVVRGEDLRFAAPLHVLLQRLLGLPAVIYRHHRLLTGPDGARYAKRDRSATLASLREGGARPEDILRSFEGVS